MNTTGVKSHPEPGIELVTTAFFFLILLCIPLLRTDFLMYRNINLNTFILLIEKAH